MKKKLVSVKGYKVEVGSLVLIRWLDIVTDPTSPPEEVTPMWCHTAGFFLGKKKINGQEYIYTGITYHPDEKEGDNYTGGDSYPITCIERIVVLAKPNQGM